jgi:predicted Ser/Thr protein kinase
MPQTIGPYRIDREIGRGGMGVIYLAHDTRLDRAVAIKSLPEDVASDPERRQRFEREARVLAALNHPNIAGIYDVEELEGRSYLALEYVQGESLAERIARGPLPLAETLEICIQMAAGIEAAHEGGIIHRDLKPANVVITPGDVVKVLDFGLAKGRVVGEVLGESGALRDSPTLAQSPTLANSPTLRSPATLPGVILGTAAYLSPEQARGKPVDRRTDIWAFGCILYECLTGTMAFEGETVSDLIAKILERDVDWSRLPKETPPGIRALLKRCLEKDPRKRLRDIGDARLTLEEIRAGGLAPASAPARATPLGGRRALLVAALAFVLGSALTFGAWRFLGPGAGARSNDVTSLSIVLPPNLRVFSSDLSRDGRTLAVIGQPRQAPGAEPPRTQIYVRSMDAPEFEPVRGTEGVVGMGIGRDGTSIDYAAPVSERATQLRLYRAPVDGSAPPMAITDFDPAWDAGVAEFASGDLLFGLDQGRAYVRIPAGSTAPSARKPIDVQGFQGQLTLAKALPHDRGVLLNATWYEGGAYRLGVGVLDLRTNKAKILIKDAGNPLYSPTGHLLFSRGDAIYAVPFDLGRLEVRGAPVAIMDGLRVSVGALNAGFLLAGNGTLCYAPGGTVGQDRHVVIADAVGAVSEWSGERQSYEATPVAISPDGTRLAATAINPRALDEIWISERGRPTSRRLVAVPGADCYAPLWSPDGSRIAYTQKAMSGSDGVYIVSADGSGAPRRIFRRAPADPGIVLTSWSPDGSRILGHGPVNGQLDILDFAASPATGDTQVPRPFRSGPGQRENPRVSPDGRWVAYQSDESGRFEIYVCGYGPGGATGEPLLVSSGGGVTPRFSRDGKRLYYLSLQNKVLAVAISSQPRLSASEPTPLWDLDQLRIAVPLYDILPDGRLIGIRKGEGEDDITRYEVVLNFTQEMVRRVKAARR